MYMYQCKIINIFLLLLNFVLQVFPLDLFSLKTYLPDGDLDDLTAIGVHKDFVQRSYGL